jgi:hypothetical protein
MSVGTSTALGIAAAAGAGASIYGAKKSSDAAQTASAQQQQAAKDAMAATNPLYQQALSIAQQQAAQGQARLDPYAQQGAAGLSALSGYLGVPMAKGAAPAAAAPAAAPPAAPPPQNGPSGPVADLYRSITGGRYTPTAQDIAQFGPNPDATYLAKIGPAIQQWWAQNQGQFSGGTATPGAGGAAPGMTPLSGLAGGAGGGATVLLRAPTGQTQAVPADQVAHYVARGATRV